MRLATLIALLCCIALQTQADVLDFIAERPAISGLFQQRIESAEGEEIERSSGGFKLMKPHYVFWNITEPDRQLLLAEGGSLTQIDWDLEVVVERTLSDQERGPMSWLMASREELDRAFVIDESVVDTVTLRSRESEALVREVAVVISEPALWEITVIDSVDQRIVISLMITEDVLLSAADFAMPETAFGGASAR